MKFYSTLESPLLGEARKKAPTFSFFFAIMVFLSSVYIASLGESLVLSFGATLSLMKDPAYMAAILAKDTETITTLLLTYTTTPGAFILSLFATVLEIVAALLVCKFFEKRTMLSLGLRKENGLRFALVGLIAGAVSIALAVLFASANGSIIITRAESPDVPMMILCFFAFLIQGFAEELLFRGYGTVTLARYMSTPAAIAVSSLVFTMLHGSENTTFLAYMNIFIIGVLFSVLLFRSGSIFLPAAFHAAWNFVLACVFGTSVSGNVVLPSIFLSEIDDGKVLTNGGAFGLEGGLCVTAVLILLTIALLLIPSAKAEKPAESQTPVAEA